MIPETQPLKIVLLSDTENQHYALPVEDGKILGIEGDILIHAGDFTMQGTMPEVLGFNRWLSRLSYDHKIVIAGNHDHGFAKDPETFRELLTNAIYLENSGAEVAGLKVWGSPITPWNHNMSFNEQDPAKLAALWAQIPEGIDILITHGPPFGILDKAFDGVRSGDQALFDRLKDLGRDGEAPRLHVFGHVHPSAGAQQVFWSEGDTKFVNACQLDEHGRPHEQVMWLPLELRA